MTDQAAQLESFRAQTRAWIDSNFPKSLAGKAMLYMGFDHNVPMEGDALRWRQALADKGWGSPTWPKEYGGGGHSATEARIIGEELASLGAFNPIPMLTGMGTTMVGPTVLEYGTDAQKKKHLPPIARGEVRWCLGLSEPNAGSDLASLQTKAVDKGDYWEVNGQKIWTSGADISQWCGALVRTDANVAKRDGISFLLFTMDQPGVTTRPIKLIAGASPFCETFFNDARADKTDLLGPLNDGWSVVKRLLQHERQSQTGASPMPSTGASLSQLAKQYVGVNERGELNDPDLRLRLASHMMDSRTHSLTLARIAAEARGNPKVTAAASILKNSATSVAQARAELTLEIMGHQGLGWEGSAYNEEEIGAVRNWLSGKAMSIYGGSYEVQNNIISKNILGLPETTQKG